MHARLKFKKDTEISYKYTQNIQEEKKTNSKKNQPHTKNQTTTNTQPKKPNTPGNLLQIMRKTFPWHLSICFFP